jgi:putative DNA primase/helicase
VRAAIWGTATDRELDSIIGAPERARLPLTELGNAQRLVAVHGRDLRHARGVGWLVWDGQRWQRSDIEVQARAKRTARSILVEEAAQIEDAEHRRRHTQWAHRSESAAGLSNMLKLAESEPEVAIDAERLDADPWKFNVLNGTLDLSTGTLHDPRREDLITKLAPVEYREGARCSRWELFLSQVTGDREIEGVPAPCGRLHADRARL